MELSLRSADPLIAQELLRCLADAQHTGCSHTVWLNRFSDAALSALMARSRILGFSWRMATNKLDARFPLELSHGMAFGAPTLWNSHTVWLRCPSLMCRGAVSDRLARSNLLELSHWMAFALLSRAPSYRVAHSFLMALSFDLD